MLDENVLSGYISSKRFSVNYHDTKLEQQFTFVSGYLRTCMILRDYHASCF